MDKDNLMIILTIVLVVANIILAISNALLVSKTLTTISPLEPTLNIIPKDDGDDLFFPKRDFAYGWARIKFKFINYGQMETGPINMEILSDWFTGNAYIPDVEKISYEYVRVKLNIRDEICKRSDEECAVEKIPNGTQKLILSVSCNGCSTRSLNKEFGICVWENTEEECTKLWNPTEQK